MPPVVIDPAVQELQRLAATTDWRSLGHRSAFETAKRIYAAFPPPNPTLAGSEAAEYLREIVALVRSDIFEQHDAYGSVRWLWYLRRAPNILFEGSYGTTLGYDRLLAEVLSSQFTHIDSSEAAERVTFHVDHATFRHLARYVGRAKLLSHLHILYRRVGKGALLDASHPTLLATSTEATDRAIQIYDIRHDRSHEFTGAGVGLAFLDPDIERLVQEGGEEEPTAILAMGTSDSFPAPVTYPDGAGGHAIAIVQVRYVLEKLPVGLIVRPMGDGTNVPDYLPEIAALIQLLMLVPAICVHTPWGLPSIAQYGYVFVGEDQIRTIINRHLPGVTEKLAIATPGFQWPSDFTEWLDALLAVRALEWPLLSGNFVRPFHGNFLIDIAGASRALLQRLEVARSPLIGNIRAEQFELQCQHLINDTPWKPSPEVEAIRGRPLRQNGRIITDIDSIGVKGRSLLIVSCKSIIYDRRYDRGEFQVIRNTQTTIDGAVVAWEGVVAALRLQPTGENFDFSQFDEIIGVVCTPFAAYSSAEQTLAFVKPDLRACSSSLELRDWLNGGRRDR